MISMINGNVIINILVKNLPNFKKGTSLMLLGITKITNPNKSPIKPVRPVKKMLIAINKKNKEFLKVISFLSNLKSKHKYITPIDCTIDKSHVGLNAKPRKRKPPESKFFSILASPSFKSEKKKNFTLGIANINSIIKLCNTVAKTNILSKSIGVKYRFAHQTIPNAPGM
ncbi:hypothetical protein GCM10022289_24050 [Pedobacter jeongneungensis]|uniref:Transposase n=1 Tax=Pedobacter jeongneungensis TaxID=947309 RepID=A0ABP8BEN4_9SPHI